MTQAKAIRAINKRSVLLVFPIKNKKLPLSLWSEFYPRSKMKWEWDEDGDNRVANLWHLMKKLSECREVVYSKWYQGRATFFSKKLFTAMLALVRQRRFSESQLSRTSREILDLLEEDSPQSTKQIKRRTDLQGKDNEGIYNRSLKELFQSLLIVGLGEVEDGAFPSLAVAATKNTYEELWKNAQSMDLNEAKKILEESMPAGSDFKKFFDKTLRSLTKEVKTFSYIESNPESDH